MATVLDKRDVEQPEMIVLDLPIDSEVALADDVKLPAGIVDLATFREWAHSDEFPQRGRIDFLHGRIWLDLSMEQLYTHNRVKNAITVSLELLLEKADIGQYFGDGVRLSHVGADLSTEPDGMFVLYDSWRNGRLRRIPGRCGGFTECEGTPDMVVEIISDSSVEKDMEELPESYRNAGIREFWRIDARGDGNRFDLLILSEARYVAAESRDAWQRSEIFGKWFQLVRSVDQLGDAKFRLLTKE
jgi:Uma2 family endonuclease